MKKKYSILAVDDDKFLLEMYRKKFAQYEIDMTISVGPDECLEKLRGGLAPDIIIFDIIMPKMDGLELLETIKKEKLAPNALAIMLTNENNPAKIEKARSLGVVGYIVKATTIPSEAVEEIIKIADLHTA
jgi:CheY-like chemotaxis protein